MLERNYSTLSLVFPATNRRCLLASASATEEKLKRLAITRCLSPSTHSSGFSTVSPVNRSCLVRFVGEQRSTTKMLARDQILPRDETRNSDSTLGVRNLRKAAAMPNASINERGGRKPQIHWLLLCSYSIELVIGLHLSWCRLGRKSQVFLQRSWPEDQHTQMKIDRETKISLPRTHSLTFSLTQPNPSLHCSCYQLD